MPITMEAPPKAEIPMSKMEQLAQKLQQSAHAEQARAAAVEKQYQDWIQSLHVLFDTLELWLQPLVQAQVATLRRDTVTITEHPSSGEVRTYQAPVLALSVNGKAASIKPLALFCFGCQGRVDILARENQWHLTRQLEPGEVWYLHTHNRDQGRVLDADVLASVFAAY
ncbi:hypothetical protein [Stenotrophomonas maltophilia]|uniref:hypothetical protein n=1 Tax=Stenotrophomonas maltophilia TaxID=40324 RepID=UPI001660988B|nr:hypothetical protein [Stenotrophomonas maltophilia]